MNSAVSTRFTLQTQIALWLVYKFGGLVDADLKCSTDANLLIGSAREMLISAVEATSAYQASAVRQTPKRKNEHVRNGWIPGSKSSCKVAAQTTKKQVCSSAHGNPDLQHDQARYETRSFISFPNIATSRARHANAIAAFSDPGLQANQTCLGLRITVCAWKAQKKIVKQIQLVTDNPKK